jgi:hypothetical protein
MVFVECHCQKNRAGHLANLDSTFLVFGDRVVTQEPYQNHLVSDLRLQIKQ